MFYIKTHSIENGHAGAFVAQLLQSGSGKLVGLVENSGYGKDTTFLGDNLHVEKMVERVADHFNMPISSLLDYYMDIAEDGYEADTTEQMELRKAIASYKPE